MEDINEIAGFKNRLLRLQMQSDALKNYFWDCIEGIHSTFNLITNQSRENNTFEIYGNKLKLQATYDIKTPHTGKFTVLKNTHVDDKDLYTELLSCSFDSMGNISFNSKDYIVSEFPVSLYMEIVDKLINSSEFEL